MTGISLVEEVEALRKAASAEKAAQQGVEKKLTEFRALASTSDALQEALAESENSFETTMRSVCRSISQWHAGVRIRWIQTDIWLKFARSRSSV